MHARYDHLQWMKLSEIARYWAAKELTRIDRTDTGVSLKAPYACPQFTIRIPRRAKARPYVASTSGPVELREVTRRLDLSAGTWRGEDDFVDLCIDLSKGRTEVAMEAQ